jgi:hypothetical protein
VSFPSGVADTGNPGVHLGVVYPLWNYEVLHRLTKRNFAVHEQRFMISMLVTVLMSGLLYLKLDL